MKILIVTNTFGNYHRQDIAVDSWRYLKKLFPENIDIIDLQFIDPTEGIKPNYHDIRTVHCLTSTKHLIEGATKNLPFVSEIFYHGLRYASEEKYDGFIWTNSDVIITKVLIERIINADPKAIACSRLDIEDIPSFQSVIDQKVKPVRWEIAGVDTCYFKTSWAAENYKRFTENRYLLGKFLFDCQWGATIKVFGDPHEPVQNGYPVACFHIHHGTDAVTVDCPERTWNLNIAKSDPMNIMLINVWAFYFSQNLARRTPYGAFLQPKPEERAIENTFFSYMNINRDLT